VWIRHDRQEKFGRSRSIIVAEQGDFGGHMSKFTLSACLGEGWIETATELRGQPWVRDVWTFRRPGWPSVRYQSGIGQGFKWQIVIEADGSPPH
jgi:hypothetical protein